MIHWLINIGFAGSNANFMLASWTMKLQIWKKNKMFGYVWYLAYCCSVLHWHYNCWPGVLPCRLAGILSGPHQWTTGRFSLETDTFCRPSCLYRFTKISTCSTTICFTCPKFGSAAHRQHLQPNWKMWCCQVDGKVLKYSPLDPIEIPVPR